MYKDTWFYCMNKKKEMKSFSFFAFLWKSDKGKIWKMQ